MESQITKPAWMQSAWFKQASDWIQIQLKHQDITVTGPIEQPHVRPWSTVLRIPTTSGFFYFKAVAAILGHEPTVTQALSSWQPDCTPTILATDLERGWMLMADGGMRLRETLSVHQDILHWEKLLPVYAEMQINLVKHIPLLLASGTPDRRLSRLYDLYVQLLSDRSLLYIDQPGGLLETEYQCLYDSGEYFSEQCKHLLDYPIPESINHGDFHDGNIFFNRGHYIFFDWGDSSVTHPFFSIRTVFVSIENTFGAAERTPEVDRLRDAYLEPWTCFASREQLRTGFGLSQRLSPISSAISWYHVLSNLDGSARQDYNEAIPSLLQEFLALRAQADI